MKKFILLGIALTLVFNGFSQCADLSNIYQFEYNGKNYEVVKEELSWDDAAACSKERGGYLVQINKKAEQDAIFDTLLNGAAVSPTYVEIFNGGGIAYVWIGANDKTEEGTWMWDGNDDGEGLHFWSGQGTNGDGDGAAVEEAFVNWGGSSTGTVKEPDNFGEAGQDGAAIGLTGWPAGSTALGSPGEWNDIIESSKLYYIIEYDSISTGNSQINASKFEAQELQVYPNPSTGILHVAVADLVKMEIFDVTGRRTGTYYNSPMDLSQFQKGVYFIKVRTQTNTFIKTFFLE